MNTLDQWFKNANCDGSDCDCCEHRIKKLIELIRKKDKALSEMDAVMEQHLRKIARDAFALTDELQ